MPRPRSPCASAGAVDTFGLNPLGLQVWGKTVPVKFALRLGRSGFQVSPSPEQIG